MSKRAELKIPQETENVPIRADKNWRLLIHSYYWAKSTMAIFYNLVGGPITQKRLAELINKVYGANLTYQPMSVEAYEKERKEALGEFMGTVIAGIYEGIYNGYCDIKSDYEKAAGRPHKTVSGDD